MAEKRRSGSWSPSSSRPLVVHPSQHQQILRLLNQPGSPPPPIPYQPVPEFKIPDGIEPQRAWRAWKPGTVPTVQLDGSVADDDYLQSFNNTTWLPGKALEADSERCFGSVLWTPNTPRAMAAHETPASNCSCGIYATVDREALIRRITPHPGYFMGEVDLWGKVVDHENGYRAQYAYPANLYYLVNTAMIQDDQGRAVEEFCKGIRERYGVPCYWQDVSEWVPDAADEAEKLAQFAATAPLTAAVWTGYNTTTNQPGRVIATQPGGGKVSINPQGGISVIGWTTPGQWSVVPRPEPEREKFWDTVIGITMVLCGIFVVLGIANLIHALFF